MLQVFTRACWLHVFLASRCSAVPLTQDRAEESMDPNSLRASSMCTIQRGQQHFSRRDQRASVRGCHRRLRLRLGTPCF